MLLRRKSSIFRSKYFLVSFWKSGLFYITTERRILKTDWILYCVIDNAALKIRRISL